MTPPPFETLRKDPLFDKGFLDPDQFAVIREYGISALGQNKWGEARVNEWPVEHIRMGMGSLANSTSALVKFEHDISNADTCIRRFVSSHLPSANVSKYGFCMYFGTVSAITQPWQMQPPDIRIFQVQGKGVVQVASTPNDSSVDKAWETEPGDLFTPGTDWYRGVGVGNTEEPKISFYIY
jgi:hypothetical protein